jgi:protoporphyrinogen/coproporphyrinogen III oxidase
MTLPQPLDVLVIGGGLAGLSAAYTALQQGLSVQVLEAGHTVGGLVQSQRTPEGYLLEFGPHSFPSSSSPHLLSLLNSLQLEPLAASPVNKQRFIYWQGHLQAVFNSPQSFLSSRLLSPLGKLKLLGEFLYSKSDASYPEPSVAQWAKHRLGNEVFERLLAPFLTGIYAGDPHQLSAPAVFPSLWAWEQKHGSLFAGALNKLFAKKKTPKEAKAPYALFNFSEGMQTLTNALSKALGEERLQKATCATQLIWLQEAGHWQVNAIHPASTQQQSFFAKKVILALPAYSAAPLLAPLNADLAKQLQAITYAPLAVVHVGLPLSALTKQPLEGFGFLVPRQQGLRLLGSIWASSLYPNRAPQGHALLSLFYGGMQDPEVLDLNEEALLNLAMRELEQAFQLAEKTLTPAFSYLWKKQQAIPQYHLGHLQRVQFIQEAVQRLPGSLALAGNYLHGINMNKVAESGSQSVSSLPT